MTSTQKPFSNTSDVASEFDKWAEAGRGEKMAAGHRYATEQLLDGLAIASDSVVLDAGCGIGWVLNQLIGPRIASGVGIDISEEMIAIASARCTLSHINFLTANSANTPFEKDKFSHIVSIESLYYNVQPLETLKEWLRISMPEGRLGIVIDLYQDNPASAYWVEALPITAHNLSVADWQSLLLEAGWCNVTYRRVSLPAQTTVNEFKASPYFPAYETYQAYCEAGSLILAAHKE